MAVCGAPARPGVCRGAKALRAIRSPLTHTIRAQAQPLRRATQEGKGAHCPLVALNAQSPFSPPAPGWTRARGTSLPRSRFDIVSKRRRKTRLRAAVLKHPARGAIQFTAAHDSSANLRDVSTVRLTQFTDLHLYGDANGRLRGVTTLATLSAALEHARRGVWPPDAVLVTGDLVQDDPAGYAHFRRLFGPLGLPVLCLPGNHDQPEAMRRELSCPPFVTASHVDLSLWRIVLLDSVMPGSAGGVLSETSLAMLDGLLADAGRRHALICLHHHPVPLSSLWLDQVGLSNAERFFAVIDSHPNVRGIVWGHVHQSFDALRNGVRLLATPSTCAQFRPYAEQFELDPRPAAYRTLELHPDGAIVTDLVWVNEIAPHGSMSAA